MFMCHIVFTIQIIAIYESNSKTVLCLNLLFYRRFIFVNFCKFIGLYIIIIYRIGVVFEGFY